MRWIKAPLLVLLLWCGAAAGADPSTIKSGPWDLPSVWDTGVPPQSGDGTVTVDHYVTVPSGTTLYGNIVMNDAATLIFQGTANIEGQVDVAEAGANFTVNSTADVTVNTTATPAIDLNGLGTLNWYGKMQMGSASEGVADRIMLEGLTGSTLNLQGSLLGTPKRITNMDVTAQTTADDLVVTINGTIPDGATHAIGGDGPFANMIWPISGSGSSVTLDGALRQVYNAGSTLDTSESAQDTVVVVDTAITPSETNTIGSSIVIDGGTTVGRVHKTFNSSLANSTAFMIDRDFDPTTPVDAAYVLTWGVSNTTTLQFARMAQAWGADDEPATDNTVGGATATGKDEVRQISFAGTITADLAELRWLGASSLNAGLDISGAATFTRTLWYQPAAIYGVYQDGPGATVLDRSALFNSLGPVVSSNGHWVGGSDAGNATDVTIKDSVAVGTLDDFCFADDSGAYTLTDNTWVDWGAGNYIDIDTGETTTVVIKGANIYGAGQTPLQMDQGTWSLYAEGVNTYGGGNGLGRYTFDSMDTGDGNALGFIFVNGTPTSCVVREFEVSWPMWRSILVSTDTPDTVRFTSGTVRNFGNYTEPAAEAFPAPSSLVLGGAEVTSTAEVVFDGVNFYNPYRRGMILSQFTNGRMNTGINPRGSSTGCFVAVRGGHFNHDQSEAEGINLSATMAAITGDDGDWVGGDISRNFFDGIPMAVYLQAFINYQVPIWGNFFLSDDDGAPAAYMGRIRNPAGASMARNTIVHRNTGQYGWDLDQVTDLYGNLALQDATAPNVEVFRYDTGIAAVSDADYNFFAIEDATAFYANGESSPGPNLTYAEAEAKGWGWTGNAGDLGNATAWQSYVHALTFPRLIEGTAVIDFVVGQTDKDGTVADAGYLPRLKPSGYR